MNDMPWNHYINGRTVPPAGGDYLNEFDPRTGKPSYRVARGNAADVDAAVVGAGAAWSAWRDRRPIERGRILWAIAQKIREHSDRLASIDQRETGRSKANSLGDIETGAQYFEYYAGLVNKGLGDVIDLGAGYHSYTRHEPFGVIAVILPWNGPVNQAGRGIAP